MLHPYNPRRARSRRSKVRSLHFRLIGEIFRFASLLLLFPKKPRLFGAHLGHPPFTAFPLGKPFLRKVFLDYLRHAAARRAPSSFESAARFEKRPSGNVRKDSLCVLLLFWEAGADFEKAELVEAACAPLRFRLVGRNSALLPRFSSSPKSQGFSGAHLATRRRTIGVPERPRALRGKGASERKGTLCDSKRP